MQVLLRKDVERLGGIGDVVNVKSGYARNYLLPQGFAVPLTPINIRRVEVEKQRADEEKKQYLQELESLAEHLKEVSITIPAKANEEGHLFGSVNATQIAAMLLNEGYKVEEKMIQLTEPIKELGVVEVPIQLKADLISSCKVWVVAE
jgi:large subunit ribosomal protein L9